MFGKQKINTDVSQPVEETADLEVPQQEYSGMPGFVPDAPKPQEIVAESAAMSESVDVPELKEEDNGFFHIVAAQELADSSFSYNIISNKVLGEVGGTYKID